MPIIWCSISAHGFGHAAQVIPILNELGKIVENVHVILRTCVPAYLFEEALHVPWKLQAVPQDIGCVQRGPLEIDIDGTWSAYEEFHGNWAHRVSLEAQAMNEVQPNLVISNISYLAIASAFEANYPVVAMASLSWDQVLTGAMPLLRADQRVIVEHIQKEYGKANHLIRLYPGIDMPAFASRTDTGPSFPLAELSILDVQKLLGMKRGEKLVFIAFGGVPLTGLPLEQMERCEGFHFLVAGSVIDESSARIHRVEDVSLPFGEVLRRVDLVMTKPGYATITTAVHYGIPLVYVRRHNFVDEQPLVDYAHQYGRAVELTREKFESGDWENALQSVLVLPIPAEAPPKPEPHVIAALLKEFIRA
jgi:hypothetical protein